MDDREVIFGRGSCAALWLPQHSWREKLEKQKRIKNIWKSERKKQEHERAGQWNVNRVYLKSKLDVKKSEATGSKILWFRKSETFFSRWWTTQPFTQCLRRWPFFSDNHIHHISRLKAKQNSLNVNYRWCLTAGVVHNPPDVAATREVCGNVSLQEVSSK